MKATNKGLYGKVSYLATNTLYKTYDLDIMKSRNEMTEDDEGALNYISARNIVREISDSIKNGTEYNFEIEIDGTKGTFEQVLEALEIQ